MRNTLESFNIVLWQFLGIIVALIVLTSFEYNGILIYSSRKKLEKVLKKIKCERFIEDLKSTHYTLLVRIIWMFLLESLVYAFKEKMKIEISLPIATSIFTIIFVLIKNVQSNRNADFKSKEIQFFKYVDLITVERNQSKDGLLKEYTEFKTLKNAFVNNTKKLEKKFPHELTEVSLNNYIFKVFQNLIINDNFCQRHQDKSRYKKLARILERKEISDNEVLKIINLLKVDGSDISNRKLRKLQKLFLTLLYNKNLNINDKGNNSITLPAEKIGSLITSNLVSNDVNLLQNLNVKENVISLTEFVEFFGNNESDMKVTVIGTKNVETYLKKEDSDIISCLETINFIKKIEDQAPKNLSGYTSFEYLRVFMEFNNKFFYNYEKSENISKICRLLHRALKVINAMKINKDDKHFYYGLLRSLFTDDELLFIYFNATYSTRGRGLAGQLIGTSFFGDISELDNQKGQHIKTNDLVKISMDKKIILKYYSGDYYPGHIKKKKILKEIIKITN